MTNEKDREVAKAWLDRPKSGPENTTERLADRFASYRTEAVKAERERCEDAVCAYWPDQARIRAAILSDDQEARNG